MRPLGRFPVRLAAIAVLVAGVAFAAPVPAPAAEWPVAAGDDLSAAIARAAAGDTLRLAAGRHAGPVVIGKSLSLIGRPGAVVEGNGEGSVITVTAPDVSIRGLTIRGSGIDVPEMDSAVLVRQSASRTDVEDNRLEGNLFGVYLHGAADSLVRGNTVVGRNDLRMSESGNGVSIWNAPGARIIGNDFRFGRDGIFVNTSRHNEFRGNRFADLRYAIHYMYTHDSKVIGNVSRGNHAGLALMFSDRLEVRDNVSVGDRDHGLLLNYVNDSIITGNVVRDSLNKCLFIYNAHKNDIHGNWFEGCPIGIHFTAGSERNEVYGNAFVSNRTQVKYVGTRNVVWSHDGVGNYWSDDAAFDLDGDGVADRPYRPNDMVDDVLWRYPQAKLLLNSPAIDLLRLAQSQFPGLLPGGVVDMAPLIDPPDIRGAR